MRAALAPRIISNVVAVRPDVLSEEVRILTRSGMPMVEYQFQTARLSLALHQSLDTYISSSQDLRGRHVELITFILAAGESRRRLFGEMRRGNCATLDTKLEKSNK